MSREGVLIDKETGLRSSSSMRPCLIEVPNPATGDAIECEYKPINLDGTCDAGYKPGLEQYSYCDSCPSFTDPESTITYNTYCTYSHNTSLLKVYYDQKAIHDLKMKE